MSICRSDRKQDPEYVLARTKRRYDARRAEAEEKVKRKNRGKGGGYKDAAVDRLYPDGGAPIPAPAKVASASPCPLCNNSDHKTNRSGKCLHHGDYLAKCEKDGKMSACACHKARDQTPKPVVEVAGAEAAADAQSLNDGPRFFFDKCDSMWG